MTTLTAVHFYQHKLTKQGSFSLEEYCNNLTKATSAKTFLADNQYLANLRALSAYLEALSDDKGNTPPPENPWYERKIVDWTFLFSGVLFLVAYTIVGGYDQAIQNSYLEEYNQTIPCTNICSTPVRSKALLVLLLLTSLLLTIHMVLSIFKTKVKEDRETRLQNKIDEEKKVANHIIAAATALRQYAEEKDTKVLHAHLKRFVQNFSQIPPELFQTEPEIGKILGKLIEKLPKKDLLRKSLQLLSERMANSAETQYFLQTNELDKATKTASPFQEETSEKLWESLQNLLEINHLDSIYWQGKKLNSPLVVDVTDVEADNG